jgi:hypothetical protein
MMHTKTIKEIDKLFYGHPLFYGRRAKNSLFPQKRPFLSFFSPHHMKALFYVCHEDDKNVFRRDRKYLL